MRPVLIALVLAACGRPTELVIIVDSDLVVASELDRVRITVTGPSGMDAQAEQALAPGTGPELPLTLGVSPAGESLGPIDVVAEGMLGDDVVVARSARTMLLTGESLALYLFLPRDCRGVTCPTGETCSENGCVPVEIDPSTLPPWTGSVRRDAGFDASVRDGAMNDAGMIDGGPPPRMCTTGADCDDRIDCTMDVCADDMCTHLANDSLCTEGPDGVCDAIDGCQYSTCTPETCVAGPCQTAVCNGTMCDRTDLCGASQTCCNNTCVALGCDDGNLCTDDACGATGCVHTPNTAPCSDGTFCNGAEVCGGGTCSAPGDPCSGSAVCDETNDVCTGCVDDADCGPPVYGDYGACGGFSDTCDTSGIQTRSRTAFDCQAGTCVPMVSSEDAACSRGTDGIMCMGGSCDGYGPCGGFSDTCDSSGTETRTCRDYACRSGACEATLRDDSRGCSRMTEGIECMPTQCGSCGPCGGFDDVCDTTGTCDVSCTDYRCASDSCRGTGRTVPTDCTRPTDGVGCDDGLWCTEGDACWGGICYAGGDICSSPCYCDLFLGSCVDPGGTFFCAIN
jgi:hypothetical protein